MKRLFSVVFALVLVAVPPFVTAELAGDQTVVSKADCCCCPAEKAHVGSVACKCDGCAQKNAQNCGCLLVMPLLSALPAGTSFDLPLFFSGRMAVVDLLYAGRTDPPLLRPPIFS